MNYTEIKSFEDACKFEKTDPAKRPDVSMIDSELGRYLLDLYEYLIIIKAINGGWVPDYGDHSQLKYYPWFVTDRGYVPGSGGGFSLYAVVCTNASTYCGARLALESEEKAEYVWNTFPDLCERVYMIVK